MGLRAGKPERNSQWDSGVGVYVLEGGKETVGWGFGKGNDCGVLPMIGCALGRFSHTCTEYPSLEDKYGTSWG